jgi:hypothetical protein
MVATFIWDHFQDISDRGIREFFVDPVRVKMKKQLLLLKKLKKKFLLPLMLVVDFLLPLMLVVDSQLHVGRFDEC